MEPLGTVSAALLKDYYGRVFYRWLASFTALIATESDTGPKAQDRGEYRNYGLLGSKMSCGPLGSYHTSEMRAAWLSSRIT